MKQRALTKLPSMGVSKAQAALAKPVRTGRTSMGKPNRSNTPKHAPRPGKYDDVKPISQPEPYNHKVEEIVRALYQGYTAPVTKAQQTTMIGYFSPTEFIEIGQSGKNGIRLHGDNATGLILKGVSVRALLMWLTQMRTPDGEPVLQEAKGGKLVGIHAGLVQGVRDYVFNRGYIHAQMGV